MCSGQARFEPTARAVVGRETRACCSENTLFRYSQCVPGSANCGFEPLIRTTLYGIDALRRTTLCGTRYSIPPLVAFPPPQAPETPSTPGSPRKPHFRGCRAAWDGFHIISIIGRPQPIVVARHYHTIRSGIGSGARRDRHRRRGGAAHGTAGSRYVETSPKTPLRDKIIQHPIFSQGSEFHPFSANS